MVDVIDHAVDAYEGASAKLQPPPTIFTAEVRQRHILQRDLLQEAWTLAARVTRHDLPTPQPITEPGQSAVTVEGVGQEVTETKKKKQL